MNPALTAADPLRPRTPPKCLQTLPLSRARVCRRVVRATGVDEDALVAAAVAAAVAICGAPAAVARTVPDAGAVARHQEAIRKEAERCTLCAMRYKSRAARLSHGRVGHGLSFRIGFDSKVQLALESAGWRPMTTWTGHPKAGTYRAKWSFQQLGGALHAALVLAIRGCRSIVEVDV